MATFGNKEFDFYGFVLFPFRHKAIPQILDTGYQIIRQKLIILILYWKESKNLKYYPLSIPTTIECRIYSLSIALNIRKVSILSCFNCSVKASKESNLASPLIHDIISTLINSSYIQSLKSNILTSIETV